MLCRGDRSSAPIEDRLRLPASPYTSGLDCIFWQIGSVDLCPNQTSVRAHSLLLNTSQDQPSRELRET